MKADTADKLVVVTGGAGFIGSCLLKELNNRSITNLVVVDNLRSSIKWRNLLGKSFAEILPSEQLFSWLEGREREIETIVHLGACSDTTEENAAYLLENNYRYSQKLVEWALRHRVRFCYASSAATYGDGAQGFLDDHEGLLSLRPLNMYGYSKHLFDLWLSSNNLLDSVMGWKFFNVFGSNESHKKKMASVIDRFVPMILKEGKVRLFKSNDPAHFADGEQRRDFIYVKDVVRIIADSMHSKTCGIYNVGRGIATSFNELVRATFFALDRPVAIEYIDMPQEIQAKYQNYTCASMRKLAGTDIPCHTMAIREAVGDYVKNYLLPNQLW